MSIAPTHVGDEILIATPGHSSTSPDRRGRIVGVVGKRGREHYRVRWPDGSESLLHPTACQRLTPPRDQPAELR